MFLGKSTASLYSDTSAAGFNVKRKRQEPTGSGSVDTRADKGMGNIMSGRPQAGRRKSSGRSTRYTIAGSMETPNGLEQRQLGDMDDSTYSDIDYRRALGSRRADDELDSPWSKPPILQPTVGWSRFALDTIGGVVGKVWELCKEGAFRGFYAGGGRGFDVDPTHAQGQLWCNEHDIPTLPGLPGGFPDFDRHPLSYERSTPESTPPPAAKRRQILEGAPNEELRKNWVMVADPADRQPRPTDPSQTQSKPPQARPSLNRRISKPVSRINNPNAEHGTSSSVSHAGSATLSNRQPASFASPRSPVPDRPTTPSRLPVPSRPRSSSTVSPRLMQSSSQILSPSPYAPRGHRRAHSSASAASSTPGRSKRRESSAKEIVEESSPRLDPRVRNMVVKRMKQEQVADARINDFNTRLMDMIRQGKEALGTTVEVDGYDEFDGGMDHWEDD